jgi:DNA-binding transcriptional ArsR family regulator
VRAAALEWVKSLTLGSDTARALLMLLADFIDEALYCEISQGELAELLGISKRTVQRWTAWLETMNFIRRIQRFNHLGRPLPDGYFLCLESAENLTRRQPGDSEPSTRRQPSDTPLNKPPIKNTHTHTGRDWNFSFPWMVDQEKFWTWHDVMLEHGRSFSKVQLQAVLDSLARNHEFKAANDLLNLMIQNAWPNVNESYWKLRTSKSSAPRVKKSASKSEETPAFSSDLPPTKQLERERESLSEQALLETFDTELAKGESKSVAKHRALIRFHDQYESFSELHGLGLEVHPKRDSRARTLLEQARASPESTKVQ